MVRILGFHCHGPGSTPSQGTEIPQATQCGQKKKGKKKVRYNLNIMQRKNISSSSSDWEETEAIT